jgi:hypothetical protein
MRLKQADKPAFPSRVNAMGYENGLSKLEYMSLHILGTVTYEVNENNTQRCISAIALAAELIKQLESTND